MACELFHGRALFGYRVSEYHDSTVRKGPAMRIFVAGATGVIGRRLVPMLVASGHSVTAMTRSAAKAPAIEAMGAEPAVTDVFDADRLAEAESAARPEAVINQLTDLPQQINFRKAETALAGNDRIRTEGTRNLVAAA